MTLMSLARVVRKWSKSNTDEKLLHKRGVSCQGKDNHRGPHDHIKNSVEYDDIDDVLQGSMREGPGQT
jgi:hypothetical protein